MDNSTVEYIFEANDTVTGIIRDAVHCSFHSAGRTFNEYSYSSGWMTRPLTTFSLLLQGRSSIAFGKSDTPLIIRNPGNATYLPAGAWRKAEGLSPNGARFIWARVSYTLFGGLDFLSFFEIPQVFPTKYGPSFKRVLSTLLDFENMNDTPLLRRAILLQNTLFELLLLVLSLSKDRRDNFYSIVPAQRFASVIEYINANFNKTLEVKKLASMAGLSKSRFHNVFKETFNITPTEYQIRLKIKEAQKLLLFSDLNMAEIADKSGFFDQFYFSRIFKNRFGQSPLKYRRNNSCDHYGL